MGAYLWSMRTRAEKQARRDGGLQQMQEYMRNCDELPTAIVTLLPLVLLLASLENKVFQYGI